MCLEFPVLTVLPNWLSCPLCRGYGKPSDKDSGSEDDDMSEEEGDTLASNTRDKSQDSNTQRLEFVMGEHVLPRYRE